MTIKDIQDIHKYFGLSYGEYLVLPRSVLQSMPKGWQQKFVKLLNELDATEWREHLPSECDYKVECRRYTYEYDGESGIDKFKWKEKIDDPLVDYGRGRRNIFK